MWVDKFVPNKGYREAYLGFRIRMVYTLTLLFTFMFMYTSSALSSVTQNVKRSFVSGNRSGNRNRYVMKKCSRVHLDAVSSLIAEASVDPAAGKPRLAFAQRIIEVMAARIEYRELINSRLKCVNSFEQIIRRISEDELRYRDKLTTRAWQNKNFRSLVGTAANRTMLLHGWNEADMMNPSPEIFQHAMFVLIDTKQIGFDEGQKVVGFCEIAMLQCPKSTSDAFGPIVRPTITNLVVSKNHRRQGLAQRLVKSSRQYVKNCFRPSALMGLYVDVNNEPAKQLYEKLGFQIVHYLERDNELYMGCGLNRGHKWRKNKPTIR